MADTSDIPQSVGRHVGFPLDGDLEVLEPRPAVYVLRGTTDSRRYTGACRDLVARMRDHRAGRVSRTKGMRPLTLVHFEYCTDYTAALKRERFLKSGVGRSFLASVGA